MPRPSNTEERRAQITGALRAVMAKKGYDGASVGDIAAHARLTPGLVHYHFKNKLEILVALVDDLAARHRQRLDHALAAAGGSAVPQVAAFIDFHLSMRWADPEALACWVTLSGEALREARVRRRYREAIALWTERLAQVVAEGVRRRELATPDATAAACAIVSAIQGYFVLAAVDRTLIPQGSAAGCVRKMAVGLLGLRGPLPTPRAR
jgi:TetR/AcrR family transcriptional regulator, transcriptional repressor of bet genes